MIKINTSVDRRISESLETFTQCGVLRWKDEANGKRAELIDVQIEQDGTVVCATDRQDTGEVRMTRFLRLQSDTARELSKEVLASGLEEAFETGANGNAERAISAGVAAD